MSSLSTPQGGESMEFITIEGSGSRLGIFKAEILNWYGCRGLWGEEGEWGSKGKIGQP